MTHSTTNTAALPLVQTTAPERIYLAVSDDEHDRELSFIESSAAEVSWSTDMPVAVCVPYIRADLATLTQQQGGEQEAGECPICVDLGWPCATCAVEAAALRSKPAASEGDVAEKEFFSREFYEEAHAGKVAWPDGTYSPQANTSKQAAGEAVVSVELLEKIARDVGDLGMPKMEAALRSIIAATPPRHPADEGMASAVTEDDLWWLQDALNSILRPNGGSHVPQLQALHDKLRALQAGTPK